MVVDEEVEDIPDFSRTAEPTFAFERETVSGFYGVTEEDTRFAARSRIGTADRTVQPCIWTTCSTFLRGRLQGVDCRLTIRRT